MFYCPIHKSKKCKSYQVETSVYNYDYDVCEECDFLLNKFIPVSGWFSKSSTRIRPDLKTEVRIHPVEYYQFISIYEKFGAALKVSKHEKFTSLRYIDNMLTKVQLYENEFSGTYLVSIRNQRKSKTFEISDPEGLPIILARDDEYVLKQFKSSETN